MSGENPCNICRNKDNCGDTDCVLNRIWSKELYCKAYECFLNYEGSCLLSLYDDCGCRKGADEE